jgi:LmbE family N-acetylglucosaminyl deacetylase
VIVFAPHPDDETFACGGTIIRKIREGFDVYVIVMTDGRHSHDVTLGLSEPSPEKVAKIRAREFSQATSILGVDPNNLVLLGFEDGKLRQHVAEAKERTVQILRKVRPVDVYIPYRDDENEDHRTTHEIVTCALREAHLLPKIYEYPVWGGKNLGSGLKTLLIDIHNELGRKIEAISKYKSQISTCFPNQEKTVLSEEFVNTFRSERETFYTREQPNP